MLHRFLPKLIGRNLKSTPATVITAQMLEPRPLPMGRAEFDVWSDRIISGTLCKATIESQKFALAEMLMHLGPTEDHKPDAYFIHCLRKGAVNQVAFAMITEIREAGKARLALEEALKAAALKDESVPTDKGSTPDEVLANPTVSSAGGGVVPAAEG